jgi:hypothetical protein
VKPRWTHTATYSMLPGEGGRLVGEVFRVTSGQWVAHVPGASVFVECRHISRHPTRAAAVRAVTLEANSNKGCLA